MPTSPNRSFVLDIQVKGADEARKAVDTFIVPLEKLDKLADQLIAKLGQLSTAMANFGKAQSGLAGFTKASRDAATATDRQTKAEDRRIAKLRAVNEALRESIALGHTARQAQANVRVATAGGAEAQALQKSIESSRGMFLSNGKDRGGMLGSMVRFAGRAVVASTAFGATYGAYRGIRSSFSSLLERNEQMRQAELGAGATILTGGRYYGSNGQQLPIADQFALSRAQGRNINNQLLQSAASKGLNYDALRSGYTATAGFLNAATQDPSKQVKLLEGIVGISDRLGVSQNQVRKTLDNIIKGVRVQNTELGASLGLTSKQIEQWREAGTLVDNLTKTLEGAAEANKENLNTWTGVKNALDAQLTIFAQKTGGGFFGEMLGAVTDFDNKIKDLEKHPAQLKQVEAGFTAIGTAIRGATGWLSDLVLGIGQAVSFFSANPWLTAAVGAGGVTGGLLTGGNPMGILAGAGAAGHAFKSISGIYGATMASQAPMLPMSAHGSSDPFDAQLATWLASTKKGNYKQNPPPPKDTNGGRTKRAKMWQDLGAYPAANWGKYQDQMFYAGIGANRSAAYPMLQQAALEADIAYGQGSRRGYSVFSMRELATRQYAAEQAQLGYDQNEAQRIYDHESASGKSQKQLAALENLNKINQEITESTLKYKDALDELDQKFGTFESHARNLGSSLVDAFFSGGKFKQAAGNWARGVLNGQAQQGMSFLNDKMFGGTNGSLQGLIQKGANLFSGGAAGVSNAPMAGMTGPPTAAEVSSGANAGGTGAGAAGGGGAAAAGVAAALVMVAIGTEAAQKYAKKRAAAGISSTSKLRKEGAREAFKANGLPSFLGDIAASDAGWAFDPLGKILTYTVQRKTEGAVLNRRQAKLYDELGIPRVGNSIVSANPTANVPGLGKINLDAGFGGFTIDPIYRMPFQRGFSYRDFGAFPGLRNLASLSGTYLTTDPRTGKNINGGRGPAQPLGDIANSILTNAAMLGLSEEDALAQVRKINQATSGGLDQGVNQLLAVRSQRLQKLSAGNAQRQRRRQPGGNGRDMPTYDISLGTSEINRQFSGDLVSLLDSFSEIPRGVDRSLLALQVFGKDGTAQIEKLKRSLEDVVTVFTDGLPNALQKAISGDDFTAPGRALAESVYDGFQKRLIERFMQEGGTIGKFITEAGIAASNAAEALARGDRAGFESYSAQAANIISRGQSVANETLGAIGAATRQFGGQLGVNVGNGVIVGSPIASLPRVPSPAVSAGGYSPTASGPMGGTDPRLVEYNRQQTALLSAIYRNGSQPITIKIGDREFGAAVSDSLATSQSNQTSGSMVPNANLGA